MAVRFIQPIETQYESQFVPMPLDFMYKAIQEKQKGLNTTKGLLGSANLPLDGAIWDIEQGNVQKKKKEYSDYVENLTTKLLQNKNAFGEVTQNLSSLNRQFQTDEEVQRILKHKEYFDKNVLPFLGKPNAASLYFRNLMEEDPETGNWKWKTAKDIKLDDIRTPIEDKTQQYVMESFGKFLTPSIEEKYGKGYQINTDPSGMYVITTPGGEKVTDLNLSNHFIQDAIQRYAKILLNEESDQAHYIKEFLNNPLTNKRGYKTASDIENFVTDVVSARFFRNQDVTPEDYKFTSPSTGNSGSSVDGKMPNFGTTPYEVPSDKISQESYMGMKSLISNITQEEITLLDQNQDTAFKLIGELDALTGSNLSQEVKNIYSTTKDPISAGTKAFVLLAQTMTSDKFNNLTTDQKNLLSPLFTSLNKNFSQISLLEQKKQIYNGTLSYVEDKINQKISEDLRSDLKTTLEKNKDNITSNLFFDKTFGKTPINVENLTDDNIDELITLLTFRGDAPAKGKIWLDDEEVSKRDIDVKIANLLGIDTKNKFTFDISYTLLGEFSDKINKRKTDLLLNGDIKVDQSAVNILKIGEVDTKVEEFVEGLSSHLKTSTLDGFARSIGLDKVNDLKNTIVFNDGVTSNDFGKLEFLDVSLVNNNIYGVPSAIYTYKTPGDKGKKISFLGQLPVTDRSLKLKQSALDIYAKGNYEGNNTLLDMGAKLYGSSIMNELDYLKIHMLARLNPEENDKITFDFGNGSIIASKLGDGTYTVNINNQQRSFQNPFDIISIIGSYAINNQINQSTLGTSGGSPMGKLVVGKKYR